MSHFAYVNAQGIVEQVIVAEQDFVNTQPGRWIQTSYNTHGNQHRLGGQPLRGNYAGVGFVYDTAHDVFYQPQPYASWTLNKSTWQWEAPIPYPTDRFAKWDETTKQWI